MPKKQRNAFYFYMVEYKKNQEESGRRFNGGLADVQDEAGDIWKTMPSSARAKYEKMAKQYKSGPQGVKYTTTGERIDDVMRRKIEIEEAEKERKETVINLVSDRKTAIDKVFFVIDVNYYCQTKDRFVINEVSIVAFSIRTGLKLVFHKIIDPGSIPMGFTASAKESEEEHGFKLPPLEMGENNASVVLSEMLDYIQHVSDDESGVTPLFTLEERSKAVESFLQQMSDIYEDMNQFSLYPISMLLYALSNKLSTNKDKAIPHESISIIALQKDDFRYNPGLACDYHEETDLYYNCTKSRAKRWVYTILDRCCPIANIELIKGDHLPDDVDPEVAYSVKNEREEARRREQAAEREREARATFTFVDYSKLNERERRHHDAITPVVVPVAARVYSADFPTLGSTTPSEKPKGAWGRPLEARPQTANRPTSSASSAGPSAPPKRAPLRKPECDAETMLAQLSMTGADTIGITRGRGRGSITSIYGDS